MVSMSKAKPESRPLPKRFYAAAHAAPHEDGFAITLDGKTVRTPQGKLLHCSSQQLGQAIAAEWAAQEGHIDTDTMPLTRLLNIALDRVELDREALLADIVNYAETDLLCYRAPHALSSPLEGEPPERSERGDLKSNAEPNFLLENLVGGFLAANTPHRRPQVGVDSPSSGELRKRQAAIFDPILAWAEETYGLQFVCTDGLVPVAQPATSLATIAALFAAANDPELAALALMTPILGSALLTLAVWKGRLSAEESLAAAHLDEAVHAEQWGDDHEVVEKWAAKCRDVKAAAVFLAAHGS